MQKCILASTGYAVLVLWFSGVFTIAQAAAPEKGPRIVRIELQADLWVETAAVPDIAYIGQIFPVSVTIANRGNDWANASSLEYALSADIFWSPDDIPLGADIINILPPGARETTARTLNTPDWTPVGPQYVLLRCDAGAVVDELDEENVFAYRVDLQPIYLPQADLVVNNLQVPANVRVGDLFNIQAEVRNNGDLQSPFCNWNVRLSNDAVLSADDPVLGVYFVPPLAPGQSAPLQAGLQIGMDYAISGGHTLFIAVDSGDKISESNENNNGTSKGFELRGFPPPVDCRRDLGEGSLLCVQNKAGGGFTVYKKVQQTVETLNLDAEGRLLGLPQTAPLAQDSVLIRNQKIISKLANGTIVFQKDIPAGLKNRYPQLEVAARLGNGDFLLAGFQQYIDPQGNTALNRDSLAVLRTDADLNLRNTLFIAGNSGATEHDHVHAIQPTADGGFTILYTITALRLIPTPFLSVAKYNSALQLQYSNVLDGRSLQTLTRTPCGIWLLTAAYQTVSAKGYDSGNQISWIDPETGRLLRRLVTGVGSVAQSGAFRDYFLETTGTDSLFAGFSALREGAPFDSVNLVFKRNSGSPSLSQQRLPFMTFQQIAIGPDNHHLLLGTENGKIWAYANACQSNTGAQPDLELSLQSDLPSLKRWEYATLTLTLKNTGTAAARDVRVDFMNQSDAAVWSRLAYVSADVPPGTTFNNWYGYWTIPNLAAGESRVLRYRIFTKVAETIPIFAQVTQSATPDKDSTPGNNISQNQAQEDDEALLILPVLPAGNQQKTSVADADFQENAAFELSVYPNPAQSMMSLRLYSPNETPIQLYLLDALGRVVETRNLTVDGPVVETWTLEHLPNGAYLIQARESSGKTLAKSVLMVCH